VQFGDLWPNALYFSSACCPTTSSQLSPLSEVILLDWEFARVGHRYNDLFQLLAYLILMSHDAGYISSIDPVEPPNVRYLRDGIIKWIESDIQSEESRIKMDANADTTAIGVTPENLSVLLVNVVLVIAERRWKFKNSLEVICRDVCGLIDSYLPEN
jgi:hypothetical protein